MTRTFPLLLLLCVALPHCSLRPHWGFWAHRKINRLAVFRLPPEMIGFYKLHLDYIEENSVNPDRRRYAVEGEAEKHYIDLDVYGDSALALPRTWDLAVERMGEDSLRKHGIAPWQLPFTMQRLTKAFTERDTEKILRASADLGHYLADIHVPLHTTRNYNGQLTGQEGIHAFWESRVPELFADDYDLWIGAVSYIPHPSAEIWRIVFASHAATDSVFAFERNLSNAFPISEKYVYGERNGVLTKAYSREFTGKYHRMLKGQVERQMKAAIRATGDFWYTCWVNAGQPELPRSDRALPAAVEQSDSTRQNWIKRIFTIRAEDG